MTNQPLANSELAEWLEGVKNKILADWERRARNEVYAASKQNRTALLDSLPEFLTQLEDVFRQPDTLNQKRQGSWFGNEHAEERAGLEHYTLDDVIYEYQILREVTVEYLSSSPAFSISARKLAHSYIDLGIRRAAVRFAELAQEDEKKIRFELDEAQTRLRRAVEVSRIGFYDWDIVRDFVIFSPQMQVDWGIRGDASLAEIIVFIHPEDRARVMALIEVTMTQRQPFQTEYRVLQPGGEIVWIEARGEVFTDAADKPIRFFGTSIDITQRKQADMALRFEKDKLDRVFASSPAGLCIWRGPDFIFEKFNHEFEKFYGFRPLLERRLLEAAPELADQDFPRLLKQVFETGETYHSREVSCFLRDHEDGPPVEKFFDFAYVQLKDANGDPYGVYDHAVEVTEQVLARRELEASGEQLRVAKEAAEIASETKSSFLANMSHEIRTPLGAVIGFSELLMKEPTLGEKERTQFLGTIVRNSKSLMRIIDDILDLAKVEAGKLVVEDIGFSLNNLVFEVVDLFKDSARQKNISLQMVVDSSLPEQIFSDPSRLRQILINLVGNAIKFTKEGGVKIQVSSADCANDRSEIRIDIIDSGIGLTQEQQEKLFAPFVQADASTTRRFGGTGLGLALSQRLANALDGAITIDDCHIGQGCTFRLTFRASKKDGKSKPNATQIRVAQASQPALRLKGLEILLAEDSLDNQLLFRRVLEREGASVFIANDGIEAVEALATRVFDVVLLDIQMPNMDGYDAIRILREKGYKGKIFALTAHAMAEERIKTKAAGFDGHLTKPLNQTELIDTLAALRTR